MTASVGAVENKTATIVVESSVLAVVGLILLALVLVELTDESLFDFTVLCGARIQCYPPDAR